MESKILNALGIDPAFIFLFMLILFVVLFILYVNVTMKYNRLKNSYATFMKGKDGKSLEQSLKDKFEEAEAVLKFTKQNRTEIRELNRKLETNYHLLCWMEMTAAGSSMQCTVVKDVTLM